MAKRKLSSTEAHLIVLCILVVSALAIGIAGLVIAAKNQRAIAQRRAAIPAPTVINPIGPLGDGEVKASKAPALEQLQPTQVPPAPKQRQATPPVPEQRQATPNPPSPMKRDVGGELTIMMDDTELL